MGMARFWLTPGDFKTHKQISMKLWIYNYVVGMTTHKSMWHCDNVGGLGEHVISRYSGVLVSQLTLPFFLLYSYDGAQHQPVDRLWQSGYICKQVPFGGRVDIAPHLWGQIPQNSRFGGMNRHFQACNSQKNIKMHITETTASIQTGLGTIVNIIKCCSQVVQTRIQQIQDGRWSPFWKVNKSPHLSNGVIDHHEIWHDDIYCPL